MVWGIPGCLASLLPAYQSYILQSYFISVEQTTSSHSAVDIIELLNTFSHLSSLIYCCLSFTHDFKFLNLYNAVLEGFHRILRNIMFKYVKLCRIFLKIGNLPSTSTTLFSDILTTLFSDILGDIYSTQIPSKLNGISNQVFGFHIFIFEHICFDNKEKQCSTIVMNCICIFDLSSWPRAPIKKANSISVQWDDT